MCRAYPQNLFWRHLFPPFRGGNEDASGLPRVILNNETRTVISRIIYLIAKADANQWGLLVRNLDSLVEYNFEHEDGLYYPWSAVLTLD